MCSKKICARAPPSLTGRSSRTNFSRSAPGLKTEVEVDDAVAGTFEPYPVQAETPLVGPG